MKRLHVHVSVDDLAAGSQRVILTARVRAIGCASGTFWPKPDVA